MKKIKKALILNACYAEIPLIKAMQSLGYYVIALGNNVSALGNNVADKYIRCDYSDKVAVLKIAEQEKIDAIVSGCTDFALLTTAYVAEKMGLSGHDSLEVSETIHLKDKFRSFAYSLGIKMPKNMKCTTQTSIDEIIKTIGFPLIVKPVDLTTGYGMTKCLQKSDLLPALNLALNKTRKDYVVVEEFLEWSNHGFSTFIQNQEVKFYFVDNEQHSINKYAVSGASTTQSVPKSAIDDLIDSCNKIAKRLNLVDGIFHLQFILGTNNVPTILEITRRAPGDLYFDLVKYTTGVDYPKLIVEAEMGLPLEEVSQKTPTCSMVRHCIMSTKNGVITDVKIDDSIRTKIIHSLEWWKKGDIISDNKLYKGGIVFIRFDSEKEMQNIIPKLNSLVKIEVENCDN